MNRFEDNFLVAFAIITFVAMVVFIFLAFDKPSPEFTNLSTAMLVNSSGNLTGNYTGLFWSNFTLNFTLMPSNGMMFKIDNSPKILTVYCEGITLNTYYPEIYPYVAQCAIIEANPKLYNNSLTKYHTCFVFNKIKVGECK